MKTHLLPKKSGSSKHFHFRSVIPKDLIGHFDGKREFQISLKNVSNKETILVAIILHNLTEQLFNDIRMGKKLLSFLVDELRDILKLEIYLDWTINYKHPIYNEGGAKNGIPYYWIFPLGILSGMRTNEMCQLRCSDIREEKRGMWFIYIEESEETKVKTENSIRKIPVHPTLKELGFIDFVGKLRRKKKDRVFWELTQTRDGYAKRVSRHFNEKYLPAVGVWEKNVKVLYCTRHTFINCLYSKGVEENVIKALVGHEKEFTMKHYGGDPFTPEQLLQEISKVSYSGINWKGLKVL